MKWGSVSTGPHFIVLLVVNGFEHTHEIIYYNCIFFQLCNLQGRAWS